MRKQLKINPIIYPQPVLMVGTYDENGIPDLMNAAWGCAIDYNMIGICMTLSHKTVKNFLKSNCFSVSMATTETIKDADFVGVVSANECENKVSKTSLHAEKASAINAPCFKEFPVCIECELDHIDEETGMVYGKIVNVTADESVLDDKGNFDLSKANGILFDQASGRYFKIGEPLAKAFSIGLELKNK